MKTPFLPFILPILAVPSLLAQQTTLTSPATAAPPAAERSAATVPEWAKGWAVVRLAIPAKSDLKDAYVDLQTPDGRAVTLTAGGEGVAARNSLLAGR